MKPSEAMVSKLMTLNGIGDKLGVMMRELPLAIAFPYLRTPITMDEAQKYTNEKAVNAAFAKVVGQFFSADEVLDLIAFHKSPIGQKMAKMDEHLRLALLEEATRLSVDIAVEMVKDSEDGNLG